MSYLDVPRLHSAETFTAKPSTLDNHPSTFNAAYSGRARRPCA